MMFCISPLCSDHNSITPLDRIVMTSSLSPWRRNHMVIVRLGVRWLSGPLTTPTWEALQCRIMQMFHRMAGGDNNSWSLAFERQLTKGLESRGQLFTAFAATDYFLSTHLIYNHCFVLITYNLSLTNYSQKIIKVYKLTNHHIPSFVYELWIK